MRRREVASALFVVVVVVAIVIQGRPVPRCILGIGGSQSGSTVQHGQRIESIHSRFFFDLRLYFIDMFIFK